MENNTNTNTNKMNEAQEEEATATFKLTWLEDELEVDYVTVQLSELDYNAVKKTGEVYPCLKVDDTAKKAAYKVRSLARQYEYWRDEWKWDLAKWSLAYLNITTKEEREQLGVEVEIQENCKVLSTQELAPIFFEWGIDIQADEDMRLKEELLALCESGAPKPKKGTRLGDALIRFTTKGGE